MTLCAFHFFFFSNGRTIAIILRLSHLHEWGGGDRYLVSLVHRSLEQDELY